MVQWGTALAVLVIGNGSEHNLDTECIVKERIFVELAAKAVDFVVVIRVGEVNLIRGDPDDGACGAPGLKVAATSEWDLSTIPYLTCISSIFL